MRTADRRTIRGNGGERGDRTSRAPLAWQHATGGPPKPVFDSTVTIGTGFAELDAAGLTLPKAARATPSSPPAWRPCPTQRAGRTSPRIASTRARSWSTTEQFTVFGAAGAVLFMVLSGLLLARFMPARAPAA